MKQNRNNSTLEQNKLSEKKLLANRQNAKKSTGPRSLQGKRASSFNATKHGMLAKPSMNDSNGRPDADLHRLMQSLREKYGSGDVFVEILLDAVVADFWRLKRAIESEAECLSKGVNAFWAQGPLPLVHRYSTSSRRGLLAGLEQLEKLRAVQLDCGEGALGSDGNETDSETDLETECENPAPSEQCEGAGESVSHSDEETVL